MKEFSKIKAQKFSRNEKTKYHKEIQNLSKKLHLLKDKLNCISDEGEGRNKGKKSSGGYYKIYKFNGRGLFEYFYNLHFKDKTSSALSDKDKNILAYLFGTNFEQALFYQDKLKSTFKADYSTIAELLDFVSSHILSQLVGIGLDNVKRIN
jgi:hypothetical protein